MAITLALDNARLRDGSLVAIQIDGTMISAIAPAGSPPPDGSERLDCAGRLVTPSFVDGHIHLDKTFLGVGFIPHRPGDTVAERIAAEKALRREIEAPVAVRGALLIEQVALFGTGALRSHVDIDTEVKLAGLHAVLELKARYSDLVDVQTVAFPQSGVLRDPGTADLLDAAIRDGADLVGGLDPAGFDGDVTGHLDVIFRIAARHGVGLDIHLHDPGRLGAFELRDIAARTLAAGLEGRVAVSHAFALGDIDDAEFGRTAERLARARVAIMTNGPGPVPMPPVLRLRQAGVTVFAGSDNIRDAWSPYGNGDMLERAMLIGYRQGMNSNQDLAELFAMATELPAQVLALPGYGLEVGRMADLIVIPAGSVPEAVAGRPCPRTVVKAGRLVVRDGVLRDRQTAASSELAQRRSERFGRPML